MSLEYNANVLFAVDVTLQTFLSNVLKKVKNITQPNVSLKPPSDIDSKSNLGLFRYKIQENSFYKNLETKYIAPDKIQNPPLVVDLFYLLTPYVEPEQSGEILTKIMQAFHDVPVLAGSNLKEDLQKSGNNELKISLNSLKMDELNHLWSLFGGKPYKMSLSYVVTPVIIPSGIQMNANLVIEKEFSYSKRS